MWHFIPYILKGMWRHRTRTLLTASGAAVALFVFCFINSIQQGLARLTDNEQAQRTLVVFQENRFCPQSSLLPQDYADDIAEMSQVKEVVPIKVYTNNCRASLDSIVFQGMPPEKLQSTRELEILEGSLAEFTSQQDAAVIGEMVAERRGIQVGEKFSIGGVTVLPVAIARAGQAADNNLIFTHLEFLQRARGSEVGIVTQFEVKLAKNADVEATATAIDALYRNGPVATATRSKGMFQTETISDLAELIGFIHWLGYACVGLVLALVATTTVMSVQDRIKEHAVLQTIGFRPGRIMQMVIGESMILSTLGGIVGVAAGILLLHFGGLCIAAEGVTIAFRPSFSLAGLGILISAVIGILAGIAPGWQAAQTKIVNGLRQV